MLNDVIFISIIIFNQAGEEKKKEQSIGWKKRMEHRMKKLIWLCDGAP